MAVFVFFKTKKMEEKTLLHKFPTTSVAATSLPKLNLSRLKDFTQGVLNFISNVKNDVVAAISSRTTRLGFPSPNLPAKKILKWALFVLAAIALLFGVYRLIRAVKISSSNSGKVQVKGASASQDINKEFSFPLRDGKGNEVSQFKFLIEKAELRDEIIVKGQRANSVKGRTFLIVNLKITNQFNRPIEIDTRDYIRLSVNGNEEEWLAPDVHNDPVEVQAISTKYTRVGFPINTTDGKLILRVGEINGDKEKIELPFN